MMRRKIRSMAFIGSALAVLIALALTLAAMSGSPLYAANIAGPQTSTTQAGYTITVSPTITTPDSHVDVVAEVPSGHFDVAIWIGGPAWAGGITPQPVPPTGTELYWVACDRVGCTFSWRGQGPAMYTWSANISRNLGVWEFATLSSGQETHTANLEIHEAPAFTTVVEVRNALDGQGRWLRFMAGSTIKISAEIIGGGGTRTWYHPGGSLEWTDAMSWTSFKIEGAQSTQTILNDDQALYWSPDPAGVWYPDVPKKVYLTLVLR